MRKATVGFVMFARATVWNNWAPTGRNCTVHGLNLGSGKKFFSSPRGPYRL